MLKFFRKIRQNLLTQNRFSKYFLYAIGEILLVVIGILIALQINNWNESRKNHLKQVDLVGALILDMSVKMKENIDDLKFGEKMIATSEKAMNDLRSGSNGIEHENRRRSQSIPNTFGIVHERSEPTE